MNLYSQEDDYFSRLDHKIVLPFPSKYDIEVVFYPIGRDVTGYFLKVYDPCDGTNFNKSYHKTEGCQKYAVGNSLYSTIIKEIKEAAFEFIFKNEHRLTVDKRMLIAHILSMKFYNDYHIELILSEYNNLNFLLSIENNCKYKIFDVQDEGYFIHKNEGKFTHRECHNLAIKNIINSDGYNDIIEINKKEC